MSAEPTEAAEFYRERQLTLRATAATLSRRDRLLSWLRFLILLLGVSLIRPTLFTGRLSPVWWVLPVVSFAIVAWIHERVARRRSAIERAVEYCERGLTRLADGWQGSGETGNEFLDSAHPYAEDLDLFGEGSLFQLLCTAVTPMGRRTLAGWLLSPASPQELALRQQAVRELSRAWALREALACAGRTTEASPDIEGLGRWSDDPSFVSKWIAWLAAGLALSNLSTLVAGWSGWWPAWCFPVSVSLSLAFGIATRARLAPILAQVDARHRGLAQLAAILDRIGEPALVFESRYLNRLLGPLRPPAESSARAIAALGRLSQWSDSRRNLIFAPLAILTLAGTQLACAMDRWRRRHRAAVPAWLQAVGEFEALCSFATLAAENPEYAFPQILEGEPSFSARSLGHPLLPRESCVLNDVQLRPPLRLLLISGSNMSGKSTLLRSVGLAVAMGQAGAPVRAREFRITPLALGASMNVRDSLREGSSHFFAEIRRLKRLVELPGEGRARLLLLDEILHGTNSHDRRVGAEALIRRWVDQGQLGLVTTHDLALARIAESLGERAANVHFADQVQDGLLSFDYKMKPGVVEHSNALKLMRSIGLKV